MTSLEKNNFKKCPMINGFNKDEGTGYIAYSETGLPYINSTDPPFVSKEAFDKEVSFMLNYYGFYLNGVIEDSINQEYVDWAKSDKPEADYFDVWNYIGGDHFFSCPAILETRYHAMAAENDIYQYFFTHVPSISFGTSEFIEIPEWLGAGHGEELTFVFGYPFDPSPYLEFYDYPEEEMALSHQIIKYWTNFAKTG